MDEQQLQIVISAIDNASATLKQVAANTSEATGQIQQSSESAGSSFGVMTASVFTAQLAYQALSETIGLVKGFLEDSIGAAIEASATMAQVETNVKNAGLSFSELGPKIDEVSKKNIQLGFEDDATQLSLSKLVLATGDWNQALKLNQLAMDLARAKNMDLNAATVLVQQVMAGNTRVMKQYGISLDSATTSAEALNTLHEKLQGSAEAFGNSAAGKVAEVKAQWQFLEQEVGQAVMPTIIKLIDEIETNLPTIISDVESFAEGFAKVGKVILEIITVGQLNQIIQSLKQVTNAIGDVSLAWQFLTNTIQTNANAQMTTSAALQTTIDAYNKAHTSAQITIADFKQMDWSVQKGLIDQYGKSVKAVATNFDDITNHVQGADKAMVKHSEAVAKLKVDYDKMAAAGVTDLATLADEFKTKMASIDDSIAKTKQNIADLTASYGKQTADETGSVAADVVASEKRIADLKTQIGQATTADQIAQLQIELEAEQKNYDSSLAFRLANADAISKAEQLASETSLQREIDEYTQKQALEKADYDQKLATLQKQLADQTLEAQQEVQVYQNKVTQINAILEAGNAYFIKLSNQRKATTIGEVNAEIAQFQALAAAIAQTKSASSSAISTVQLPNIPGLPQHESGGFVNAPRGVAVPIIAHGGEEVIPAEQASSRGGNVVNIQIVNPSVRKNSDLDDMRQMIEDALRPVLINAKVIHI